MYIELHQRILPYDIHQDCIEKYNCNPWFEYEKHLIAKREVENGIAMILKNNRNITREYINHYSTCDRIVFYLGERE